MAHSKNDPWKLISFVDGQLHLEQSGLTAIATESAKISNASNLTPLAFLCIIGPPRSGKSFYTNLLVNYFEHDASASFVEDLSKGSLKCTPGFAFGGIESFALFNAKSNDSNGIYVWPNPFVIDNDAGQGQFVLWVLHLSVSHEANCDPMPNLPEMQLCHLLQLICSKVIAVSDDNQCLSHEGCFDSFESCKQAAKISYRKSAMYIFRSSIHPFRVISIDTRIVTKENQENLKKISEDTAIKKIDLLSYQYITAAYIENKDENLHDEKGRLSLDKKMYEQLQKVVIQMATANEISPNSFCGQELTDCPVRLESYFNECIELTKLKARQFSDFESSETSDGAQKCKYSSDGSIADDNVGRNWKPHIPKNHIVSQTEEKEVIEHFIHPTTGEMEVRTNNIPAKAEDNSDCAESSCNIIEEFTKLKIADNDIQTNELKTQPSSENSDSEDNVESKASYDDTNLGFKMPLELSYIPHMLDASDNNATPITNVSSQLHFKNKDKSNLDAEGETDEKETLPKSPENFVTKSSTAEIEATLKLQNTSKSNVNPTDSEMKHGENKDGSNNDTNVNTQLDGFGNNIDNDDFPVQIKKGESKSQVGSDATEFTCRTDNESTGSHSSSNYDVNDEELDINNSEEDDTVADPYGDTQENQDEAQSFSLGSDNSYEESKVRGTQKNTNNAIVSKSPNVVSPLEKSHQQPNKQRTRSSSTTRPHDKHKTEHDNRNFIELLNQARNQFVPILRERYSCLLQEGIEKSSPKLGTLNHEELISHFVNNLQKLNRWPSGDIKQLQTNLLEECVKMQWTYITVHQQATTFNKKVTEHVKTHLYLSNGPSVNQMLDHFEIEIFGDTEQQNKIVTNVVANLRKNYLHSLEKITEMEKLIAEYVFFIARSQYNKIMETIVSQPVCPSQLAQMQHKLLERFVIEVERSFKNTEIFSFRKNENSPIEMVKDLKNALALDFKIHRETNILKLENLQKEINRVITLQKKAYCFKMTTVMQQDLELSSLNETHKILLQQLKTELQLAIREKTPWEEPTTKHFQTLEIHISKYWRSFKESHQTRRNKNPQAIPNRGNGPTDQVFKSRQTLEIQTVSNLPPIIYQISMDEIKYAIQDGDKERNYPDELAKVGITADGVWYFGNACESQPHCQTMDAFKLRDYLNDGHKNKYVYIRNHKHLLSLELLLSFVLASLKRKVEEDFRGQIRECIIIIPFWLPSVKRQQILDAGKVAGFSDVCLINENSAIAAYFVKTEISRPDVIFIMSANSAWVDVTAYTIEDGDKIKMIAHCGSYEVNLQAKRIIQLNHVEDACSKVDSQISSRIDKVLAYLFPGGIKSKFYYASYDSINHRDILSKALKSWVGNGGYKHTIGGWNNGIAIKGALLCAQLQNRASTYKLKEWIGATVYYSNQSKADRSSKKWEHLTKKVSYLPFNSKPIDLPEKTNELSFFQSFPNCAHPYIVGLLKVKNLKPAQANNKIYIHFDHQAVPLFANEFISGNHDNVEWRQNNLDKQDIDEYKTLLKNIFDIPMQQKDELNKRIHLTTMFSTLKKRILAGQGTFKSDTIKNMTIDQINDSLKTLADSADTATFANQQDIYTKLNAPHIFHT